MSVRATTRQTGGSPAREAYAYDDSGYGWVAFAGVMLLILGTLNFIEGVAAIGNAHFFVANTHYIAGSLNTWGWIVLWIGVIEWLVGIGVFAKNQLSRWIGVIILACKCDRAAADDARVPVLVAVHLHARHPRDLRSDRARQEDLGPRAVTGYVGCRCAHLPSLAWAWMTAKCEEGGNRWIDAGTR